MAASGRQPTADSSRLEKQRFRVNYLRGSDPSKWQTGIPAFAKVSYEGIYPGVDLVYYGNQGRRLEYDFVVAPGAEGSALDADCNLFFAGGTAAPDFPTTANAAQRVLGGVEDAFVAKVSFGRPKGQPCVCDRSQH